MRAAVLVVSRAVGGSILDAAAVLVVFAIRVHRCAVPTLLHVLLWQPLTLHVSLDPEVGEQHEEEGSVHPDEVDNHGELVVAAVHEVILRGVKRHQDKLGQLNGSHVFLPPQKLLEAWSSSSKAVVEIHDDVDGRIHHGMEGSHSTRSITNSPPPGPRH